MAGVETGTTSNSSSSQDFVGVCDKELNINDFYPVYDKVRPLSAHWEQIAISLRLRIDTINSIEANFSGKDLSCLRKVFEYWLKKDYDYKTNGVPCWRRVCVAVKKGGGDPALADEIAREHPLPAMPPAGSTSSKAVKEGGGDPALADEIAREHPLPATTGGATPHPLPATTGRATPHPLPVTTGGASPYTVGGPTDVIHNKGMSPSASSTGRVCDSLSNDTAKVSSSYGQALSPENTSDDTNPGRKTLYVTYPPSQPPNQGKNLEMTIKLQKMNEEFADLFYQTRKALDELHLPDIIEYIEAHVVSLLSPNDQTPEKKELVRKEFNQSEDARQLFYVLEKHVSWFNYSFIFKIVKVFLQKNKSLKESWSSYDNAIQEYFMTGEGQAIQCVNAVAFGLSDIPGTKAMIFKVERDNYTLNDLAIIYHQIPSALKVPNARFYFSSVTMGCLELNYLIPNYLYLILFPLNEEQLRNLARIDGISKLKFGKHAYNIKEVGKQQAQHNFSKIDICDPLWYENTSTPLHEAAWRVLKDEVQWLLDKFGHRTYHRGLHGWTPLHSASYGGHIEILQLLIHQYGIDANEGDDNSVSSIHMASYKGHLSIVQYLVDTCDVPPDQPDNSNNTALLYSAMGGHSDLVEFFIERNCDTSQINYHAASISMLACIGGELALVHKLEAEGLFISNSSDFYGLGILHYSTVSNNVELFKYLLNRYQLPIDVKDQYGRTPLQFATWFASSSVVEYIVSIQGNEALLVNDNNNRYSCLHYAAYAGMQFPAGLVYGKLFAQRDAPVIDIINNTTIKQNIDFIKQNERVKMFSSLLKKASTCPNFDIKATTNDGQSLLHLASKSGSTLLIKALEEYNINNALGSRSQVHNAALSGSTSALMYLNANNTRYNGEVPLANSCQSGSINCVKYLINSHYGDPNIIVNNGITCLHQSCRHGHIDITQYLIEVQHCDVNKTDNKGRTLVHHAAWSGNLDLVQYLIIEQGLSPTVVDENGLTALHYASLSLNLSLIKELITTYQLDPHQADSNGKLPIHYAAESGDILLLELYVKVYKCNLSLTDKRGWNIIHFASFKGHTHVVKHMNHQLDLMCAMSNDGMAPIHLACSKGINLVQYIIEHIPSSLELPHRGCGRTPFLTAVYSNQLEVIKYLISKKCNLLATDDEGSGAVHISVARGHLNVLKYLIDIHHCNPNATNHRDFTPLHFAVTTNRYKILEYLLSKSIPSMSVFWLRETKYLLDSPHDIYNNVVLIDIQNKDGNTPLHYACGIGLKDLVSLLLEASLSNNNLLIANKKGHTPLHLAVASGYDDTVEALLSSVSSTSTHHDLLAATDNEGSTVLHTACSDGHIDMFRYLASIYPQGVDVSDNRGRGLLHAACEGGEIRIVKILVETYGLDPELVDEDGITCLHLIKRVYIYQYLKPNIASNPVPKDKSGRTPLHYASHSGNIRMARYLIETFPCTPDDPDNNGYTSVHGACEAGSMELVQYFLTDHKFNALAETADHKTLLYYATISSNLELVRFLVVEFGFKPRPHDIDVAKAANPDSAIANYLQKIFDDMIFDMMEEEKRMKEETHHEKHKQQQIDPQIHDIVS